MRGQGGFALPSLGLGLCFLEQAAHQLQGQKGLSQLASLACPQPSLLPTPRESGWASPRSRCRGLEGEHFEQECPGRNGRMGEQSVEGWGPQKGWQGTWSWLWASISTTAGSR